MTIGNRLREARKNAGLTQKELATKVGLAEITIRNYEADKYEPKTNQLTKLANALHADGGYLMYGVPTEDGRTIVIDINREKLEKTLQDIKAAEEIYRQKYNTSTIHTAVSHYNMTVKECLELMEEYNSVLAKYSITHDQLHTLIKDLHISFHDKTNPPEH